LRSLGIGLAAGSVARVIPLQAAEYAHKVIREEKTPKGSYQPKFFTAHQYKTLQALCAAIIPSGTHSGGALEAGAPEFIDLLTQQKQVLDLIAYRKNAASAPGLSPGIEFFSFLRKFVADGYFTSAVGIKYLEYIGNTSLTEFPGCPEVNEA
jgi:gluconate 2-dehydrogenase gamma chain